MMAALHVARETNRAMKKLAQVKHCVFKSQQMPFLFPNAPF